MVELHIEPTSLVCAVGHELEASLLAMRAGISALDESWLSDDDNQPITAAMVPELSSGSAATRATQLLGLALVESRRRISMMPIDRVIVVCSEITTRRVADGRQLAELIEGAGIEACSVECVAGDETSPARVLARLRSELHGRDGPVLLCAVDSLLDRLTLARASARKRLRTDTNVDGFAPGEAAAAVLVHPRAQHSSSRVAGIGFATEPGTIHDEQPCEAQGMTAATRAALAEAGWGFADLQLWLADLGGEQYEFEELALTHARLPTERCDGVELWHPSQSFASVGVAGSVANWIIATWAARAGWTPGRKVACSSAAAAGNRALVMLETPSAAAGPVIDHEPRWAW